MGLGNILKCEKAIDFRSRGLKIYENMGEMKIQLIDAIKAKQGCVSGLVSSKLTYLLLCIVNMLLSVDTVSSTGVSALHGD